LGTSRCCCASSPARITATPAWRRSRSATRDAVDVGTLHVAAQVDNGLAPPTPETVAAVRAAADALRAAGADVRDDALPAGGHELTLEVWRS
jgi:Asp-tRNA(Asn)/Glu-tRNA(Gln) amidotransferase A subunit family amidase